MLQVCKSEKENRTQMEEYPGKVCLQQRVFPYYRKDFFERLAAACEGGFSLFAGQPREVEGIRSAKTLERGEWVVAQNRHLFSGTLYLCYQQGILSWLQKQNPAALIVEANPRYPSSRLAIRWMKKHNKPVIGWGLGAPPVTGRFAALRTANRKKFITALDAVLAYSQNGADEYLALGMPPEKVFVAYNAAVPRPATPIFQLPPHFDGKPKVLFVGRLQQRKRLDLLFEACRQLPSDLQPEITIVGDGPARVEFETLAAELYPAVQFVGEKHGAVLGEYYAQADLFVLPGTGGLAIQQAMAQGLPVVVAEGDGTQKDLVRPQNGWLVAPGKAESLKQALQAALSNPEQLRQKGMESYRIVSEEINLDKMVETFIEALQSVTEK